MTERNLSRPVLPPHSASPKHLQKTPDLRNHSGSQYPRHSMTLRMSSPRSHLMNFWTVNHGTMLLNLNWVLRHPPLRSTRSLRMSRNSWMPSLGRTWLQDVSGPPNHLWRHRSSSSRRGWVPPSGSGLPGVELQDN